MLAVFFLSRALALQPPLGGASQIGTDIFGAFGRALVASLIFTLTYATVAAKSRRAEMIFTVVFFVSLFPGSVLHAGQFDARTGKYSSHNAQDVGEGCRHPQLDYV
jgi:hypothetical protein